ncbi:MAG: UpxY family transcription antiterminator [Bacteroidota bacterium]|nr:UpxY family transcription antiterminator [Bacteroidota bacterium]
MGREKRWLAVYTKPRWEKKINQQLGELGITTYCPLNRVHRQWSDRVKLVEEPLFKSYVFVQVSKQEELTVRKVPGVFNFVMWLGKPAVVRQLEIEKIKRFLRQHTDVEVLSIPLAPKMRVVINAGVLMDRKAIVIRANQKLVELEIESMGTKLIAFVDRKDITPLHNPYERMD